MYVYGIYIFIPYVKNLMLLCYLKEKQGKSAVNMRIFKEHAVCYAE